MEGHHDKTGIVFGIQPFSLDDGPGVRTTVFLKGCAMRCAWCHNPESLSSQPELRFFSERCIHCGACASACPEGAHVMEDGVQQIDFERCQARGTCVPACPNGALVIEGVRRTAEDIIQDVLKDKRYYASGGGLTLGGGEPMCQFAFTKHLLSLARQAGINTAMETNGAAPLDRYLQLLPDLDWILFDYKLTDDAAHIRYTGQSNRGPIETLTRLLSRGAQVILRCPIIPGVNDDEAHFAAIAALSTGGAGGALGFQLMPYHNLGASKARQVGREQPLFRVPDAREVAAWRDEIIARGGVEWRADA